MLVTLGACAQQDGSGQSAEEDVDTLRRLITQEWPAAALAADTTRYASYLTDDSGPITAVGAVSGVLF